jgi:hypothetical protein
MTRFDLSDFLDDAMANLFSAKAAHGAAADPREYLTQRGGGRVRINGGSGDIRQKRMKHHMVFAAEQKNLTLGIAQLSAKSFCELDCRKSSTNDDYPYRLHFIAPVDGLQRTFFAPVGSSITTRTDTIFRRSSSE